MQTITKTENALQLLERLQDGDDAALEELVVKNSGLIWSIARRFFGRGVEPDDLYQLGCIGFLKAARGFDLNYGTQFSTYAVPKISGEIRRFLRDDGMVKVSRTIKERASLIRATREKLLQQNDREPHLSEISEICGLSLEEIADCDLSSVNVESLSKEADGLPFEGLLGVEGHEEAVCDEVFLQEAIKNLPERERNVINLRYYRNFTQTQAAKVLGVSQVQISRIEKRALRLLKETAIEVL